MRRYNSGRHRPSQCPYVPIWTTGSDQARSGRYDQHPTACQCAPAPIQSSSEAASGPALPIEKIVHPTAPVSLTDLSAPSTLSPYFSAWREMSLSYRCPVSFEYSNRGYIFCFCADASYRSDGLCPLREGTNA